MPLPDILRTMLWLFALAAWLYVIARIIADLFISSDLGGAAKTLWFLAVSLIPLLGAVVYLLARGDGMAFRVAGREAARQEAMDERIRQVARESKTKRA